MNRVTGQPCKIIKGKPEPDCVFREALTDKKDGYGSLMYKQSIQQVYKYTNSTRA